MSTDTVQDNFFVKSPLGPLLAKTALPIIFVMSMNGLLTVVDAIFLGIYVGPDALSAVTLMFPASMLIIALATLVSNGMSSVLARHLGASRFTDAQAIYAGAHGLALAISLLLIILFFSFGQPLALIAANGSLPIAEMGHTYMQISIVWAPVFFVLAVNSDALRNEGMVGFMAASSLLVSLSNIGFNYVLIVLLGLGVAGSAYGTVCAQVLSLTIMMVYRVMKQTHLPPSVLFHNRLIYGWREMLALGAPQSLNFLGFSLGTAATIAALQWIQAVNYEATIAAYGILTRIMTFIILPHIGLSKALQSIIGNNYGARLWARSNGSLQLGIAVSLAYCLGMQTFVNVFALWIAGLFTADALVQSEITRILPVMTALFFAAGPLMIIATYFQAIGDASRAAILSLIKPYLFLIPLIFGMAAVAGEPGIWLAGPASELMLLVLTVVVLAITARKNDLKYGLFMSRQYQPAQS
ncbi:MATE family efflux transporter [Labrenzia sp. PHM005]|uniref:MATE family efflux transporter n=1 Tax=Labrenzia sp. PHM005 TaxID=2590016 RepID=UPI0011403467|nr:MATE family efflux transporter [Labrenzia sp. PHM005]QDG79058.1 MATE family efflux transporter [Labrenzia sp. PHM005]